MSSDRKESSRQEGGGPWKLFSREAMAKLAGLNRAGLRRQVVTAGDLERAGRAGREPAGAPSKSRPSCDLKSLCPGQVVRGPEGACYVVRRTLTAVAPEQSGLQKEYERTFAGGGLRVTPDELHQAVRPLVESPIGGIAYLDIETCGLAGMPLFLLGFLVWERGALTIRQYLARDYSEERAALARAWRLLDRISTVVTFNGGSFDVPFIEDRSSASGLAPRRLGARHVDMLHESRRRWKRLLPNCRLQTLERFVCGRLRSGDIPSELIPAVYHEFVRTGDARQIEVVLHHNALDLITLAELAVYVLQNREVDGL